MNYKSILFYFPVIVLLFSLTQCGKDEDLSKCAKIELLQTTTATPANVSILFKVKDCNGKPIPYLDVTDFEIYENGKVISEYEASRKIFPVATQFMYSTILYLDLSGSILASQNLEPLKNAAASFVESIMPAADDVNFGSFRMGIKWFDGAAEMHTLVDMTTNKTDLKNAIMGITSNISSDNSTNFYGSVIDGITNGKNYYNYYTSMQMLANTSLVFFTDGTDQANRVTYSAASSAIDQNRAHISYYTIGLGGEVDEGVLKNIGRDGFEIAANLTQLTATFGRMAERIKDESNSYYLLKYCSPKRSGDNMLKITIKNFSGAAEQKFSARNFTGGCNL